MEKGKNLKKEWFAYVPMKWRKGIVCPFAENSGMNQNKNVYILNTYLGITRVFISLAAMTTITTCLAEIPGKYSK